MVDLPFGIVEMNVWAARGSPSRGSTRRADQHSRGESANPPNLGRSLALGQVECQPARMRRGPRGARPPRRHRGVGPPGVAPGVRRGRRAGPPDPPAGGRVCAGAGLRCPAPVPAASPGAGQVRDVRRRHALHRGRPRAGDPVRGGCAPRGALPAGRGTPGPRPRLRHRRRRDGLRRARPRRPGGRRGRRDGDGGRREPAALARRTGRPRPSGGRGAADRRGGHAYRCLARPGPPPRRAVRRPRAGPAGGLARPDLADVARRAGVCGAGAGHRGEAGAGVPARCAAGGRRGPVGVVAR